MSKILIVDDTPSNIDILVGYLAQEFELLIALNGLEALNITKNEIPNLILLDIRMPEMDGFQVCKKIKSDPRTQKIPVIFLTAETDEQSIQKAFEVGGVDYLKKPIILEELKARVRTHLNLFTHTHYLETLIEEKRNELKKHFYYDKITSLKNKASLDEDIHNFLHGSLYIIDINNFNIYNKLYGFLYGNKILQATAEELQRFISMYRGYYLYKLSVDRFAIISDTYNEDDIESFCLSILHYFDDLTLQTDTIDNFVNFCIGISAISDSEKTFLEAEYALDHAKTQGNRTYAIYSKNADFIQDEYTNVALLKKVRKLISNDHILPFFQPIVDVHTEQIVKYEALARLQDGYDILSPYDFLDNAERLGMMPTITKNMIKKSFEFFSKTDLEFSINLTQRDVMDETLLEYIKMQAFKNHIDLKNVTFEILESLTLSHEDSRIQNMIGSLKECGSSIAIDDFGSENSNFSRLLSLQADFIKIDGLFIRDCDTQMEKQKIISSIVKLANALEMKTIAEFVSSKEIFETVKSLGIDYVQGYYFGKPLANI